MNLVRQAIKPTAESRLTKIGIFVWVLLFVIAAGRVAWNDHSQFSKKSRGQQSLQIVAEALHETIQKRDEWKAAASRDASTSPTVPDPRLMSAGSLTILLSDIRTAIYGHTPVAFLVTSAKENDQARQDIEGIVSYVCQNHIPPQVCMVVSPDQIKDYIPPSVDGGITFHVVEDQASLVRPLLIDSLKSSLSRWFLIKADTNIPAPLENKFKNVFVWPNHVWIDVGRGSLWKNRVIAMRDGIDAEDRAKIAGKQTPLKQRVMEGASRMDALYGNGPLPSNVHTDTSSLTRSIMWRNVTTGYIPIKMQIISELVDLRIAGYDAGNALKASIEPKDYEDIDTIRKTLSKLAGELK